MSWETEHHSIPTSRALLSCSIDSTEADLSPIRYPTRHQIECAEVNNSFLRGWGQRSQIVEREAAAAVAGLTGCARVCGSVVGLIPYGSVRFGYRAHCRVLSARTPIRCHAVKPFATFASMGNLYRFKRGNRVRICLGDGCDLPIEVGVCTPASEPGKLVTTL